MPFEDAHLANPKVRHLLREARKFVAELRVRVRIRGGSERNPLFYCQLNDSIARVKLVHWLAPSSGRKLDREILRANKIECFLNQTVDLSARPMTVDFDQIKMGKAIN